MNQTAIIPLWTDQKKPEAGMFDEIYGETAECEFNEENGNFEKIPQNS